MKRLSTSYMTCTFSTIPASSVGKTTLSCRLSLSSGEKTKQKKTTEQCLKGTSLKLKAHLGVFLEKKSRLKKRYQHLSWWNRLPVVNNHVKYSLYTSDWIIKHAKLTFTYTVITYLEINSTKQLLCHHLILNQLDLSLFKPVNSESQEYKTQKKKKVVKVIYKLIHAHSSF